MLYRLLMTSNFGHNSDGCVRAVEDCGFGFAMKDIRDHVLELPGCEGSLGLRCASTLWVWRVQWFTVCLNLAYVKALE